jgi:hypothetical protein
VAVLCLDGRCVGAHQLVLRLAHLCHATLRALECGWLAGGCSSPAFDLRWRRCRQRVCSFSAACEKPRIRGVSTNGFTVHAALLARCVLSISGQACVTRGGYGGHRSTCGLRGSGGGTNCSCRQKRRCLHETFYRLPYLQEFDQHPVHRLQRFPVLRAPFHSAWASAWHMPFVSHAPGPVNALVGTNCPITSSCPLPHYLVVLFWRKDSLGAQFATHIHCRFACMPLYIRWCCCLVLLDCSAIGGRQGHEGDAASAAEPL